MVERKNWDNRTLSEGVVLNHDSGRADKIIKKIYKLLRKEHKIIKETDSSIQLMKHKTLQNQS